MKLIISITTIIAMMICGSVSAQGLQNDLSNLSIIQKGVKSKRISSYDRTGGADDFIKIAKGEKKNIFQVEGAGIINHIWITIAPDPGSLSRNDIVLRMYWDGKEYPSVESPIGPFFGQGWNESYEYSSLPLSASPVQGRGLVCYFTMPFEKGARIEIENQAGRDISAFYYQIDYEEMEKLPASSGRFHAWYNKELTEASETEGENEWGAFGKQAPNETGKDNYLIADLKGKGHFVGVNYYIQSPTPIWYGEGDDMIFIDGAELPTLNGTGTEDYFNTSWGAPKVPYSTPYYGYAKTAFNDVGFIGRTHIYRFNIADPVYFDKSLKFTIEHGRMNGLTLDLASVSYWYQSEASKIPSIPGPEARKPRPLINGGDILRWRQEWRKNRGNDPNLWN